MEKVFEKELKKDGFGVRIVAKFDTSTTDWLAAINSSLNIDADCKVPGSDWREVLSKGVGLAYEDFGEIAGTGVGFKLSEVAQVGPRTAKITLKLKSKFAGKKKTLKEDSFTFSV